ncbi:unnamed protein product, partial [Ixodes persulcatus]
MKPMPSSPMMFLAGTRTSSKKNCAVSDEWCPIFLMLRATAPSHSPGVFRGRQMSDLVLWGGPSRRVLASRHIQSAWQPLVIHILPPLITRSSPLSSAVVLILLATSEPQSGSETPTQPIRSPAMDGARNCFLSSSEPYL